MESDLSIVLIKDSKMSDLARIRPVGDGIAEKEPEHGGQIAGGGQLHTQLVPHLVGGGGGQGRLQQLQAFSQRSPGLSFYQNRWPGRSEQ